MKVLFPQVFDGTETTALPLQCVFQSGAQGFGGGWGSGRWEAAWVRFRA